MFKKIIPLVLAVCVGLAPAVYATGYGENDEYTPVSGEAFGPAQAASAESELPSLTNDSIIGSPTQLSTHAEQEPVDTARSSASRNSNTTDNTDLISASQGAVLAENADKNNGMAAGPVAQTPGASRYSTVRISLSPDIAGTKYEEAAELLGALGIMVGDAENGAFRPNDPIIRSEMAKVAVYSVGLEDMAANSGGASSFPDVPSDHWATGAINTAHAQGMVIGDSEGTYRPDDPVLLQEAVAIIVRAMGYEPAAADKGGYPGGYLSVASSNQLLRGTSGASGQPATRGDIAQLIFNALTVNLMDQVTYGSQTRYEVVDKTLLFDNLNVEKGFGKVIGTEETSVTGGNTTAEDKVQIDDKLFRVGDSKVKQFLGYNVLYYARVDKTSDEKTIICVREQSNKNNSVTITADNISSVKDSNDGSKTVTYLANGTDNTTKTAQIASDAVYIYNGKYKTGVTSDQLKPESGNLVLLDSDTNGIYETIFVNHLTNIVADTVSSITGRVTDKYMNGSLVFDDDDNNVIYSLTKNGEEIKVTDIKEWNVISYTVSEDKKLIKAYVSDAEVSGTVSEINNEGFRIGGSDKLYKKAANYPNDIKLRDRGTFYLDINGDVAAVDTNSAVQSDSSKKYGYLTDGAMGDSFDTTAKLKVFTASGETAIMNTTEKLRFNDQYSKKAEDVINVLKNGGSITPQLIIYEVNSSGEVTAIETAHDGTSTGAPNKGTFTLNISNSAMVYKAVSGKLGNVGIDSSTVVFEIPSDAGNDTDKYSVRNGSSLSDDTSYSAKIYDLQDNYLAKAVIITSSTGTTSAESPIFVVDYISETQNSDEEITDRLYGFESGSEKNLLAADKNILKKSGSGGKVALQKGDIIQYRTNTDGDIDGITLLFDSSAKSAEFSKDVTNDMTCVYGKVTKKFSGSINVKVGEDIRNFATGDAYVYLYDSARNSKNIEVVSSSDIEIYEEGNEARIFIRIYKDQVKDMVIIK